MDRICWEGDYFSTELCWESGYSSMIMNEIAYGECRWTGYASTWRGWILNEVNGSYGLGHGRTIKNCGGSSLTLLDLMWVMDMG